MISDHQLEILIEEVFEFHGFDFGGYSRASLKRRVDRLWHLDGFNSFDDFRSKIKSDDDYFKRLIQEITVNVTEMFRDPQFYRELRTKVLPRIGAKPFIRIWHAGCSTGEEVYSMAILLKEANLLHKSLLYATDINSEVLDSARSGVFPLRMMKQYSENYIASGGTHDFSKYYTANYGSAKFDAEFTSKMVFAQHSLVSDRSFNEFELILCRNVLIYFDNDLQNRALQLFDDSLPPLGFIALGSKETLKHSTLQLKYELFSKEKIWQKTS